MPKTEAQLRSIRKWKEENSHHVLDYAQDYYQRNKAHLNALKTQRRREKALQKKKAMIEEKLRELVKLNKKLKLPSNPLTDVLEAMTEIEEKKEKKSKESKKGSYYERNKEKLKAQAKLRYQKQKERSIP